MEKTYKRHGHIFIYDIISGQLKCRICGGKTDDSQLEEKFITCTEWLSQIFKHKTKDILFEK